MDVIQQTLAVAPPPQPPAIHDAVVPAVSTSRWWRGPVGLNVGSVLLLLVMAVVATLPGWMPGRVYVPTDALELFSPWGRPTADFRPRNEVLLDQTVQFVPWMKYTVERLRHRDDKTGKWVPQVPLWNPYQQLGVPFLANGQSAVFFPTTWLHVFMRPEWSWTLSAALRLWIAGLGTWLLAKRYSVGAAGAILAAMAFMLCGFNVVWLNHPHTNVMVLLPWAILVLHRLIERPRFTHVGEASILFALQFLGGHPASSVHLLFTCGIFFLIHLLWLAPRKALVAAPLAVLAVGVGFALAGAQWLPLMAYVHDSAASIYRESNIHQAGEALHPQLLLGTLFPYANGFPPDRVGPYHMEYATGLSNPNELAGGFVGTVPLLLAILGLLWMRGRRMAVAWAVIGGVALLIAMRFPGVNWLVQRMPVLRLLQNGRLIVTTAFALALLSGFGLDAVLDRLRQGLAMPRLVKTLKYLAIVVAGVSILLALGLLVVRGPLVRSGERKVDEIYESESQGHEHTREYSHNVVRRIHTELVLTSLRLLIPAGMIGGAWYLLRRPRGEGGILETAFPWIALAAIDLLAFAIPYNFGSSSASYFPSTPATSFLDARQAEFKSNPFRMAGTFRAMHPDSATGFSLLDTRGYDALTPARYREWIRQIDGQNPDEMQSDVKRLVHPDNPAFSLLGLRYVLTAPDHPVTAEGWKIAYPPEGTTDNRATIYERPSPLPRAWVVPAAQWYDAPEQVRERLLNFDFDPRQLVLLDREMNRYDAEMAQSVDQDRADRKQFKIVTTQPTTQSFVAGTKIRPDANKVEFLEDSPERIRIRIKNCTPGWLVLADTYSEGWTVKAGVGDPLKIKEFRDIDRFIVPAYGIVRAIPIAMSGPAEYVGMTLEYRPRAWKMGLFTSAAGGVALLLIYGAALFVPSRAKPLVSGVA